MKPTATHRSATSPRGIAKVLREMSGGETTHTRCGDFWIDRTGLSNTAALIIARHLERLARLEMNDINKLRHVHDILTRDVGIPLCPGDDGWSKTYEAALEVVNRMRLAESRTSDLEREINEAKPSLS